MDLAAKKQLINEFLEFQINGDRPYFNFYIGDKRFYSTNELIDFLLKVQELKFDSVDVTPF